ncbi:MAG: UDP-N-acetylmuramoyl-tripeptide--D-alanyl-D-alanine ligase [Rhodomicrobium sp.]|nr:MAG: UDP-N-acetylmuramoyl-tripeptide--D-alanyl-D-alanine ligase [Rhodomicrobium sp.]
MLWTVAEIVKATGGIVTKGGAPLPLDEMERLEFSSVSIDSRTLSPGALYVAIMGVSQDGHQFVGAAVAAGAAAALVKVDYVPECDEGVLIRVPDPLVALEAMGRAARERMSGKVIAVTGSAGKTGTKEALRVMLERCGKTHASVKSFNNHWGVPLSLARMPRDTDFAIFEVGMNHAGEISPLSKMIRPDAALITTIAPVHIGHFNNEVEIADAKAEIFDGLVEGGVAILPVDNPHYDRLVEKAMAAGVARIVPFGKAPAAEARMIGGQFDSEGSRVSAEIFEENQEFILAQAGVHVAVNMLAALAAVKLCGADLARAAPALSTLEPPEGRGVRHKLQDADGSILLIDESYNANPASMAIALRGLAAITSVNYTRRIAVIGDMLELGDNAGHYHLELAPLIEDLEIDKVYAAGEIMAGLYEALPEAVQGAYALTAKELSQAVVSALKGGDVVMVKGSLGSEMSRVVTAITDAFAAEDAT